MIIFDPIRTKRIAVRLREISIEEAVSVCRLPADRHEATASEFLRFVARDAETPTPRYIKDPRLMTVQERTMLVCRYLGRVSPEGADFKVGDLGKLTDFIKFSDDILKDSAPMGKVAGVDRVLYPLLGVHAEMLERVCANRGDWLMGMLACQVHDAGATPPDYLALTDVELIEWVRTRIDAIKKMAESDLEELYVAYERANDDLRHFFIIGADDQGIVWWPQTEAEEAGQKTPARFLAVSCISEFTRRVFGGPTRPSR